MPSMSDKPNIYIDISSHTPSRPARESLSILPYIQLYITMRHLRFHFLTPNNVQGKALTDIATTVLYRHANAWRTKVLESGNVKEVKIWWKEKCMDIVLWPGSQWAIDWECCPFESHVVELKEALGLAGTENREWKGAVVVAGIEE
jgi:hypothetical protein